MNFKQQVLVITILILVGTRTRVIAQALTDPNSATTITESRNDHATTNEPVTLPAVVVSAPQEKAQSLTTPDIRTAEAKLACVPGGINLINAKDTNKGRADNIQDILQGQPGLIVQSRGGTDDVKLTIRGEGLDRGYNLRGIRLLQDGIPISQTDGDGDFQSIEPSAFAYTEVYRGSNALQFGAATLGGAVNFVSYTGYNSSPLELRYEMGSYGYYKGSISSGFVIGPADYYINFSAFSRDGFQNHTATSGQRLNANFGYKFNANLENRIYFSFINSDLQLGGTLNKYQVQSDPTFSSPKQYQFQQAHNSEAIRLGDKIAFYMGDQTFETRLYWTYRDLHHPLFWNQFYLNGLGIIHLKSNSYGVDLKYETSSNVFGQKNNLTIGFNPEFGIMDDDHYQNLNGHQGSQVLDGRAIAANFNLYAENRHYLLSKFSLVTGLQLSEVIRKFQDNTPRDINPNGNQSQNMDYFGFNPKVGLVYEITPRSQIFANFSCSFNPPGEIELQQLGGHQGNTLSVPLKAETATSVEIGTRGKEGRFAWDITYYYSQVNNELLTLNDATGNPLGTVNASPTTHQGVEAGLNIILLQGLLARNSDSPNGIFNPFGGSYDFDSETEDRIVLKQVYNWSNFSFVNDSVYGHNTLPGVPIQYYRLELVYQHPCGFYVGLNCECILSKYPGDYANTVYVDPYALLGFTIGYESKKGFSVFFEARNLTNQHYASAVEVVADASAGGSVNPNTASIFESGEGLAFYGGVSWKF